MATHKAIRISLKASPVLMYMETIAFRVCLKIDTALSFASCLYLNMSPDTILLMHTHSCSALSDKYKTSFILYGWMKCLQR